MNFNKKLVSLLVVISLLLATAGLAIANDVNTKNPENTPLKYRQMLDCDKTPTCFETLDQLVEDQQLTEAEANIIKQEIREQRNACLEEREEYRADRVNRIDGVKQKDRLNKHKCRNNYNCRS
ncbi:MAG: hypothetical protein GX333_06040 [Syntrophomonadaceae bacterium]|nr:hypothetical protein [Syntrophomonadaceae bacterium]